MDEFIKRQISHALLQSLQFSYFDYYCVVPVTNVFIKVNLANNVLTEEGSNQQFVIYIFFSFFS